MKTIKGVLATFVIFAWFSFVYFYVYVPQVEAPQPIVVQKQNIATTTVAAHPDYKNATYKIEGVEVALVNGVSEMAAAPNSASLVTTTYFGNEAKADLNADGKEDVVFLLTQNTGGTGLFYYLVAAIATADGYQGSEAYFIGDRIAPQTTEVSSGVVVVNYADRKEGASFAEVPTEGKSLRLTFDQAAVKFIPQ